MAPTTSQPQSPSRLAGLPGLHAYQVALAFYRRVLELLPGWGRGHVQDQLRRASESTVLNIAEAYPALGADRARRFRTAGDEASECGAALDLLEANGVARQSELTELRGLLDRLRAMLWRLGRSRAG
jgi:four helix bundle protein